MATTRKGEQHTPTPWRVAIKDGTDGWSGIYKDDGNTTHFLADVASEADARLIAAAPEMLALIRTLEFAVSTGINDADKAELRKRARALLARLDAAPNSNAK